MRNIQDLFTALSQSKFRKRFHLKGKELEYFQNKGMPVILEHARDFIEKKLAPEYIPNDGKQTPMKNHPVFIAQHATATCCRECLEKWHFIPKNSRLSEEEICYILVVIETWLKQEVHGKND